MMRFLMTVAMMALCGASAACGDNTSEVKCMTHYEGLANVYDLGVQQIKEGRFTRDAHNSVIADMTKEREQLKKDFPDENWDKPESERAAKAFDRAQTSKTNFEAELAKMKK